MTTIQIVHLFIFVTVLAYVGGMHTQNVLSKRKDNKNVGPNKR